MGVRSYGVVCLCFIVRVMLASIFSMFFAHSAYRTLFNLPRHSVPLGADRASVLCLVDTSLRRQQTHGLTELASINAADIEALVGCRKCTFATVATFRALDYAISFAQCA